MATRKSITNSRVTKKTPPGSLQLATDNRIANIHERRHLLVMRRLNPEFVVRIMMLAESLLPKSSNAMDIAKDPNEDRPAGLRLVAVDGVAI